MAETDLGSIASQFIPNMSSVYTILIWVLGILTFGIVTGVITWITIDRRRYNRIITIYENQNGVLKEIGEDRARVITIDKGLAKVWYLKKQKLYSQPFVYSTAKGKFPVIRKADGDLENFELRLTAEGQQVIGKIMPTSIRMANANIRRYMKDTYKKDSFMDKYGKTIMMIVEMVIFGLILIIILEKTAGVMGSLNSMMQKASEYCVPASPVKLTGA